MDNALNLMIAKGIGPEAPAWDYQKAQANALNLQGAELELQNKKRDWELRPMKDEATVLSYLTDIAPLVQYENYPMVRQDIIRKGISANIVPDPSYFEQVGQQNGVPGKQIFDIWKNNAMTGLQRQALRIKTAGEGWKPPDEASAVRFNKQKAEDEAKAKAEFGPEKTKTEEMLTRDALKDAYGREPTSQEILDAMQKRKIATAQAMPAPTVYVGTTPEGKPIVTGGAKGSPEFKSPEVPGGGTIGPKPANMPSEMVVAEQQLSTLQTTLDRVDANYDPSYVGPVGGRIGAFKENWVGIPEKQAMFYSDLAQINNSLVYLMSGKQINEQEFKRLQKQLPTANLPEPVFKSRMKTFKATLKSILEERHKNMKPYGVKPEAPKADVSKMSNDDLLKALEK